MPMLPKAFLNYPPNTSTPINAAALSALELRVGNYVGQDGMIGPGVAQYNDFVVSTPGGMTINVGVPNALQSAFIALDALGSVSRYEYAGPQLTLTVGAADPTNPRIDRVVLKAGATDSQIPVPQILPGTPTGGTTLDSLAGAAAIPVGYLLLADVFVGAAAVTVAGQARERRSISSIGASSPIAAVDAVTPIVHPNLGTVANATVLPAASGFQYGYTCYLPRRIVGATRFRWKYQQLATALTGNYNIGILDGSGRVISQTGAVALTGAGNSWQARADLFSGGAQTFEAGQYIIFVGWSSLATGQIQFQGVFLGNTTAIASPSGPGIGWVGGSGGTTFPASIGSSYDGSGAGAFQSGSCPVVALSVT